MHYVYTMSCYGTILVGESNTYGSALWQQPRQSCNLDIVLQLSSLFTLLKITSPCVYISAISFEYLKTCWSVTKSKQCRSVQYSTLVIARARSRLHVFKYHIIIEGVNAQRCVFDWCICHHNCHHQLCKGIEPTISTFACSNQIYSLHLCTEIRLTAYPCLEKSDLQPTPVQRNQTYILPLCREIRLTAYPHIPKADLQPTLVQRNHTYSLPLCTEIRLTSNLCVQKSNLQPTLTYRSQTHSLPLCREIRLTAYPCVEKSDLQPTLVQRNKTYSLPLCREIKLTAYPYIQKSDLQPTLVLKTSDLESTLLLKHHLCRNIRPTSYPCANISPPLQTDTKCISSIVVLVHHQLTVKA